MSRLQGPSSLKRKQRDSDSPSQSLTEHERLLYDLIRSKQEMAIWTRDMKRETNLPDNAVNKSSNHFRREANKRGEFINFLKKHCVKIIYEQKAVTLEGILDSIRRSRAFNVEFSTQQIEEIVNALVLDNEILCLKSSGMGEFDSFPVGQVVYTCKSKGIKGEPKIGAMASIPCGVCPHISLCTPDGVISPRTCVYFSKWLDF
ncbi:DNA-directed RNA polymerase III subunit RPC6 [Morella rubra]|uniref:DNA-directed RNA polymerase III subunit RPC6 n=1 Tax=Morella rubra TaxID=262757 RepID=A0A6A1UTA2_9ROSI|nr:DNA-directed RNA polymerase III subunit RPC6 [Morella rubra]